MFVLLLVSSAAVSLEKSPEQSLRLKPGNYWVYKGTVEWTEPAPGGASGSGPSHKKEITWKTEIIEEQARGALKAYLVKGAFNDLPWYEPDRKPGSYIWVVYASRLFILPADPDLLQRFHDPADTFVTAVANQEPVLQFPLRPHRCTSELEPEEPRTRTDLMYCWYVEARATKPLKPNLPEHGPEAWNVIYQSNPDHQIIGLVPGTGFVSYDFSHHGTLAEAHVRLVDSHLQ